jgi:hypothetical protein
MPFQGGGSGSGGGGGVQTPWTSNIDGGGYTLTNTGNVGMGNDGTVAFADASHNFVQLFVGSTTVTSGDGIVGVCANKSSVGTTVGRVRFANTNLPASGDIVIAEIRGDTGVTLDSGTLAFVTYSSGTYGEKMRLTSTGRLGLGATSPAAFLHVKATSIDANGGITIMDADHPSTANPACSITGQGSDAVRCWYVGNGLTKDLLVENDLAADILFATGGTEKMRITSAGGISINSLPSTNPGAGSKRLWYDPADSNRVKYAP